MSSSKRSPAEQSVAMGRQGPAQSKGSGPSGQARGKKRGGSGQRVARAGTEPPPTDKGERKGIKGVAGSKNPERRCTATSRGSGERCKAPAIKGGNVCITHGGRAPQVRAAAKERLLALVDPALAALYKVLTSKKADDAVKVRAALGILDRTGHGPSATMHVQNNQWDIVIAEAIGVDVEQLGDVGIDRTLPASRPTAPGHVVDEDIVDAEVVGEDNG